VLAESVVGRIGHVGAIEVGLGTELRRREELLHRRVRTPLRIQWAGIARVVEPGNAGATHSHWLRKLGNQVERNLQRCRIHRNPAEFKVVNEGVGAA
jgi:hypothetical protein